MLIRGRVAVRIVHPVDVYAPIVIGIAAQIAEDQPVISAMPHISSEAKIPTMMEIEALHSPEIRTHHVDQLFGCMCLFRVGASAPD
jgi:hypothetical protein